MIIHWALWKLRVEPRSISDEVTHQVVVCEYCGSPLKNHPRKTIFANETGFAYCSNECATQDVKDEAERRREADPNWSGF